MSQTLPREVLAALAGLYAILAGFILSRSAGRRTEDFDARADFMTMLVHGHHSGLSNDSKDRLLIGIITAEMQASDSASAKQMSQMRQDLLRETHPDGRAETMRAFDRWQTIRRDRLALGERLAIWISGGGSVLFAALAWGSSPTAVTGLVLFGGGVFLSMFTISDYDRNRIHGARRHGHWLQQGFQDLDRPPFLPEDVIDNGLAQSIYPGREVRTGRLSGDLRTVRVPEMDRSFFGFFATVSVAVLAALIALPLSGSNGNLTAGPMATNSSDRRQGSAIITNSDVIIANPGWSSAQVIAEVLRARIERETNAEVSVVAMSSSDAARQTATGHHGGWVHPDLWWQNFPDARKALRAGDLRANGRGYPTDEGLYFVNHHASSAPADLDDATFARQFDTDGDGLGEIWVGDPEWPATDRVRRLLREHTHWEAESYSHTIFSARLDQAEGRGESLAFYGYEPDNVTGRRDVERLRTLDPTCTRRSCQATQRANVVWREGSVDSDVTRVLERTHFSADDIEHFIQRVEEDGATPLEVAREWLAARDH